MKPQRWVQVALLTGLLTGMMFPPLAQADAAVSALVEQLKRGQVSDIALQGKGMQRADHLFLLGWLYDRGSYGVPQNRTYARQLLQQAAEKGQFDAMDYCWYHCLTLTPEVLQQLQRGVEGSHKQALYLQARLLRLPSENDDTGQRSQSLLTSAASQGLSAASDQLFVDDFIDWSKDKRTLEQAEEKLELCVDQGRVVCYYLLGAFYQRHDYPQWALFYYQVLALVDPPLYRSYLSDADIAAIVSQRPQPNLEVVRSRAASYLSQRGPTGNPAIDRFQVCKQSAGLSCVESLSQAAEQCSLSYFENTHLRDLPASTGYQTCVAQLQ
ncbi:MAG: SEL1-like repeat protein [Motiliproteus sp.]